LANDLPDVFHAQGFVGLGLDQLLHPADESLAIRLERRHESRLDIAVGLRTGILQLLRGPAHKGIVSVDLELPGLGRRLLAQALGPLKVSKRTDVERHWFSPPPIRRE